MKDRTQVDTYEELKAAVEAGMKDIEEGRVRIVAPEDTDAYFDEIKAEALALFNAKRRA
ncbi:MAG TPA: hypothetical protein VED40_19330 [Azospirillaceae bacterium]|nr:hypothetical protein [Azospirillaceae bacterium]